MKGDVIFKVFVNFLIPFLLLYAFFVVFNYEYLSFFAVIHSLLIFSISYALYYFKYGPLRSRKVIPFKFLGMFLLFLFIVYMIYIIFMFFNFDIYELVRTYV